MKSARNLKMTEGDIILSNRTMGNSKSNATLNTARLAKTNMMFYRTNGLQNPGVGDYEVEQSMKNQTKSTSAIIP